MKRLVGVFALASLLTAICASHSAWSLPPPGVKQKICHIEPGSTTGQVLEIAKSAIGAHCRNHPDFTNVPATAAVGSACTRPAAGAVCAAAP
jgi:hypothetical protein